MFFYGSNGEKVRMLRLRRWLLLLFAGCLKVEKAALYQLCVPRVHFSSLICKVQGKP